MPSLDRAGVLASVRMVLAADCNCEPSAFERDTNTVVLAGQRDGRRAFPHASLPLIVTMGHGVVISTSEEDADWMRRHYEAVHRDDAFSAQSISRLADYLAQRGDAVFGPDLKYTCAPDDLSAATVWSDVRLVEGYEVPTLYRYTGFSNALQYDPEHPQPDVLATVVYDAGLPVGVAGASADSTVLWQIGIDVLPAYRGKGIGFDLVRGLTRAIFERGKVPYYSTSPSNIASRRLARRVGFWPAWTEISARAASVLSHLDD